MTSGFEKSGTVLTVHLPAELDHPASDEIRRDSDRIIGHNYIKNMIFDFSETVFMDSSGIGLLMGRYRALGMRGKCVQVVNVNSHIAKLLMENTNEMTIIFDSRPVNEALARVAVASFCTQLNPTLEEISDLKTAVSEAVTNCIIHGYEGEIHKIRVECRLRGQELQVDVTDHGAGIPDIKKAMEPLFTTKADKDRSGMGFTFMEAFMDELQVESEVGRGTTVHMKKIIRR